MVCAAPGLWRMIAQVEKLRQEVRLSEKRLAALELWLAHLAIPGAAIPPPVERLASTTAAELHEFPHPHLVADPVATRAAAPFGGAPIAPDPIPPPPRASQAFDNARAEQLFGGIWLQNIGAVLLLFGAFFMILWGYTTGRIGPGVLMLAGLVVGLGFVWRGDRMSRRFPAIGHALIGVGLGIDYLSIYLGHFTLHVLPTGPAIGLLALVSFASVAVGLRYRSPAVAALGVVGAFVPQLLAIWIPLKGFTLSPLEMLGYLTAVNIMMFALAARAGWSALDLASMLFSAFIWIATFRTPNWGWGVEAGLTALFMLLGLAQVPRLVRSEDRVRNADLAVVVVAPVCLIATSWPFLAYASRPLAAILLLALATLYVLGALWVDARRREQDLWRALTFAAILFLTAALQRAVGYENTPMTWCAEGTALVALGLIPRRGWLRLCGYAVSALGITWLVPALSFWHWEAGMLPVFHPGGIRDLVCVSTLLVGAWALARGRSHLSQVERYAPEIWAGAGNLLLLLWSGREAWHVADALEGSGGRWQQPPAVTAPLGNVRLFALVPALMGFAWGMQAALLLLVPAFSRGLFLRICGYIVLGLSAMTVLMGLLGADGWSSDQIPILYPAGHLNLACIVVVIVAAVQLARGRALLVGERLMPKLWTVAASLLLLAWSAREADHLARAFHGIPGAQGRWVGQPDPALLTEVRTLGAVITSGAWLTQAIALMVIGWARDSAFLRWSGLALCGLTVLKVLGFDLQTVDVFWRFVTAIVVGATLLAVSYAYQRRTRAAAEPR